MVPPQRRRTAKLDQSAKVVTIFAALRRRAFLPSCHPCASRLVYQAASPDRTEEKEPGAHDARVQKLPPLPNCPAPHRRRAGQMAMPGVRHPLYLPEQTADRAIARTVDAGADDPRGRPFA